MSKRERELLEKLQPFGIVTWDHAVAVRNGAKTFATRMSRNASCLETLIREGRVRRATKAETEACRQLFLKHTDRIVARLTCAVANRNWKLALKLADILNERNFSCSLYVIV